MEKKPLTVKKPWGKFEEYTRNEKTSVKIISVNKGGILSLQSHKHRKEFWVALDEGLTAEIFGKKIKLKKGQTVTIHKKTKHRISATKNARFLEISYGKFDENDIKRYEDKYGRAK
ncbi:MAG TPA: phosphomannose isomerase type II C-terminal cupin domain [archaeon]|nr:phosphomannose isomerase type II C-terminal cupin domain [archaeon]